MFIDALKLAIIADAAAITTQQREVWKHLSNTLIEEGAIQRLTEEGLVQAIDVIAYKIAMLSFKTLIDEPEPIELEQLSDDPRFKPHIDNLEDVLIAMGLASGIHTGILAVLISERVDYWGDKLCEQIKQILT